MDYIIIFFVLIIFVVLIIVGLPRAHTSFNDQVQQLENTQVRENFTQRSSEREVQQGASTFYDWAVIADQEPKKKKEKCEKKTPEYKKCKDDSCLEDHYTYEKTDYNIYPVVKEQIIHEKPECSKCDASTCKNIDKYVLKSSVPPCPDMSKYALKTMIPPPVDMKDYIKKSQIPPCPNPMDMADYIKKSQIPPCPKCPDLTNYVRKSEIPACPPKVECPQCPVCPKCPDAPKCPDPSKQKCPEQQCPKCPDPPKCPDVDEMIAKLKKTLVNECKDKRNADTQKVNGMFQKIKDEFDRKKRELGQMKRYYANKLREHEEKRQQPDIEASNRKQDKERQYYEDRWDDKDRSRNNRIKDLEDKIKDFEQKLTFHKPKDQKYYDDESDYQPQQQQQQQQQEEYVRRQQQQPQQQEEYVRRQQKQEEYYQPKQEEYIRRPIQEEYIRRPIQEEYIRRPIQEEYVRRSEKMQEEHIPAVVYEDEMDRVKVKKYSMFASEEEHPIKKLEKEKNCSFERRYNPNDKFKYNIAKVCN